LRLGCVVKQEPARHVPKPGILLEPRHQAAFGLGIEQTVRLINELLGNGVVRWVPAKRSRAATRR